MSQMKALLILIKFIKNAFVKNQYLTLFWGLESWKGPENDRFGSISNLHSVKSISHFYEL